MSAYKIRSFLLAFVLMVLFTACGAKTEDSLDSSSTPGNESVQTSTASEDDQHTEAEQIYLDMAQQYLDEGDYGNAIRILETGYETTGSASIQQELENAIAAQLSVGDTAEAAESGQEQASEENIGDATGSTPSLQSETDTTWSVTSRITGSEITAQLGITAGVYSMTRYNRDDATVLLPFPVTWSDGVLAQCKYEDGSSGSYYGFKAESSELTDSLMQEYMDTLVAMGFTQREERLLSSKYYYFSVNGLPEVEIREGSIDGHYMLVVLPAGYGFDLDGTDVLNEFRVASIYTSPDWDETKDTCRVSGFDGTESGGAFNLYFVPGMYVEGDCIGLDDFLSQTTAGTENSLYYCHFFSDQAGENGYKTVTTALDKESYNYFRDIDIQILKKDSEQTVIYFYLEVDAGIGVCHRLEGIVNAVSPEGAEAVSYLDPDGDCKNCGGTGYVECTRCNGDGEVDCSLCGGDGKKLNVITGKQDLCTRCHGRGKQDCGACNNGRTKCSVCGGSGGNA